MNDHTGDLPEFIVEKLERYEPTQLDAVIEYARDDAAGVPQDLPDDIVSVFALQDETTVAAIRRTAREMLEEYGEGAAGTTAEDPSASEEANHEAAADAETAAATEAEGSASGTGPDRTGYEGMAEAIVERAAERVGEEKAVSMAREVDRLDVDDEGRVRSIEGSEQIVVEHLADRYIQYIGMAVRNSFADVASEFDVETPVNIDMTFN